MHFLNKKVVKDLQEYSETCMQPAGRKFSHQRSEKTKAVTDLSDHQGVLQDFAGKTE